MNESLRDAMKRVASEHPLEGSYDEDARYNWPERWNALWDAHPEPASPPGEVDLLALLGRAEAEHRVEHDDLSECGCATCCLLGNLRLTLTAPSTPEPAPQDEEALVERALVDMKMWGAEMFPSGLKEDDMLREVIRRVLRIVRGTEGKE